MLGNTTLMNSINTMPRKLSCKLDAGNSNIITDVKRLTYATDWTGTIAVGQVVSSYISVTVPTPSFSIAGVNVALSMGIGDPVTWTKIGDFRIEEESVRKKQGYTGFNAFDKLYNTINIYHSSGNKTLQAICNEVCTAIGITSTTLSADLTIDSGLLDGYTLRDVLGFIAAYQGKNAYLSPNGVLEFRWFTTAPYVADGTRANIPYIGENNCTIRRWICQTQEGTLTSGSGEGLYFTCPFMTQARLDSLAANQQLVAYRKADVDIPFGNYLLQAGDIITVSTTGSNLTVPIMSNSWTYDGGVASSVSSYGASDYTGTANNAERSLSATRVQRQMAVYRAASELKSATELITGASGGYIKINFGGNGKTAELLVMDQPNIEDAVNVWVFNQNGLGHFPNGYGVGNVNVALTRDGWVKADRIWGEMISGVGIENVDNALTTKPKIALSNGCIHFTETYDYSGSSPQVTDIGKLEYLQRSGQNAPASLALTVQQGNRISIGDYGYPKFVYNSTPDSSQGEEKFMFHCYDNNSDGAVRILGNVLFGTFSNPDGLGGMDLEATIADIYSQINGGDVPAVTSNDDGKVLTASYSGGVGTYSWETGGGGGGSGTVTSIAASGSGIKTDKTNNAAITDSGTISLDLKSTTKGTRSAASKGNTSSREYAVGLDSNGYLSVNVPWTDNSSSKQSKITYSSATPSLSSSYTQVSSLDFSMSANTAYLFIATVFYGSSSGSGTGIKIQAGNVMIAKNETTETNLSWTTQAFYIASSATTIKVYAKATASGSAKVSLIAIPISS